VRRWGVWLILPLLLAACRPVPSAPQTVAAVLTDDVRMPKVEGLRAGLERLGYPADAVRIEVHTAKGDRTTLRAAAEKALAANPRLVLAGGGVEAVTLKEIAGKTPIVMMGVASSVRSGLVDSLIHPGGRVTGVDNQHAELSAKRLELLTKLLPEVRRVLLLYDPEVIPGRHALEVTEAAARRLRLSTRPLPAATREQLQAGLQALVPGEYDAALLLPGYVLESSAHLVASELARLRLPAMGPIDLEGESGLLAAYGVSLFDQGLQSARFVVKLLQGVDPATIPVETPDTPNLVVDLRVARRLGLQVSPVGLALARSVRTEGGDAP